MKLDHFNLSANWEDLQIARDFYCDVLGMTEGDRPGFKRRGFWLYAGSQAVVHLIESEDHLYPSHSTHLDHIAFRSDSIDSIRSRLDQAGLEYRAKGTSSPGMTQLFFLDPLGTRIEINGSASTPD